MHKNEQLLTIVPKPKQVKLLEDTDNYVVYDIKSAIFSSDEEFEKYINTFINFALKLNNVVLKKEEGGIELKRDMTLEQGQYSIVCDEKGITASASDNDGIVCALATLHQIITVKDGVLTVPSYTILDKPDCSYRAFMIDLARQWHTLEQVKSYIDLCYLYKIKFIHLHFTDIQSYTLPSHIFPKLSTVGRSYSKKEIEDINNYASERNVEIIPEIDIPGHSTCINTAYPDLFDHNAIEGETKNTILCLGKPGFFDNIKKIIQEMIEMFPNSRYIHVGGDEAEISTWDNCYDCKKYMQDNGIENVRSLYTHFVKKTTDMVLELGKIPVVWEGFPKEGAETISKEVIVTVWESLYHLSTDLVEEGFTITNSSWLPLYIVRPDHPFVQGGRWYAEDVLKWNIFTWRNWWDKSFAYEKPIVLEPTDKVIGGTVCAWESNYPNEIIPVKENLSAFSERVWNINGSPNADEFLPAFEKLWCMAEKILNPSI